MSLKKNLLYNFLLSFSQFVFPLISIPYISRILDPSGIGKVNFIDSVTYYFIVIAEFGIVTYAIREVSRKKARNEDLKPVVSELLSLHLITSCISVFLYVIAVSFLFTRLSDFRLILFSVSFLLVNGFACEWYFWGTEQFKYITFRSLITRILGLVSIFVLIKQPQDYIIYYAIIAGTGILNLLWNSLVLFSQVNVRIRKPDLRLHWPFLKITFQISLLYSVVLMLDNVFLQLLSTSAAVAYYAYSAKIVRMAGALVTDTLLVFYPRAVSLVHAEEKKDVQRMILHASHFIILSTIPMAAGIFLVAEKLTAVYFGDQFHPLARNLKILSIYPFLKAYSLFLNKQLLMTYDKERIVLIGLWIGAAVFIITTLPLSFYYADNGTSMAVIASETTVLLYYCFYVRNWRQDIKLADKKVVLHAIGGSIFFFPLISLLNGIIKHEIISLAIDLLACIFFYFTFLFFIIKNQMIVSLTNSIKLTVLGKFK